MLWKTCRQVKTRMPVAIFWEKKSFLNHQLLKNHLDIDCWKNFNSRMLNRLYIVVVLVRNQNGLNQNRVTSEKMFYIKSITKGAKTKHLSVLLLFIYFLKSFDFVYWLAEYERNTACLQNLRRKQKRCHVTHEYKRYDKIIWWRNRLLWHTSKGASIHLLNQVEDTQQLKVWCWSEYLTDVKGSCRWNWTQYQCYRDSI